MEILRFLSESQLDGQKRSSFLALFRSASQTLAKRDPLDTSESHTAAVEVVAGILLPQTVGVGTNCKAFAHARLNHRCMLY